MIQTYSHPHQSSAKEASCRTTQKAPIIAAIGTIILTMMPQSINAIKTLRMILAIILTMILAREKS